MSKFLIIFYALLWLLPHTSLAEMSSGKYKISDDSIVGVGINDNLIQSSGMVLGAESENITRPVNLIFTNELFLILLVLVILFLFLFYFYRSHRRKRFLKK